MDIVPKETQFEETVDKYVGDLLPFMSEAAMECTMINRKPKKASRNARVLEAFQETFEIIGGVARLALWADSHPGEYYKLWGKQIPGMVQQMNFNGPTQINITPALPRSPLDGDDTQDAISGDAGV